MIQETCLHILWLLFEGLRSQSLPVPRTLSWLGYQPPPGSVHQTGSVKHRGPAFQQKHHGQQLGTSKKYFTWGGHLARGRTRQFSLVDGTCLKRNLEKTGWSGGKVFPQIRLRGNCLAPESHEDKGIPLGGWTLGAPVQFWFSGFHSVRSWVFWTLCAIGLLLRTAWWAMKT